VKNVLTRNKGGVLLLLILRYIFSIIAVFFAVYGLFTKNFEPFMILFLALTFLIMGLEEFQKKRKIWGGVMIVVFLYSILVTVQAFLYR